MKKTLTALLLVMSTGAASAASVWVSDNTLNVIGKTALGDYSKIVLTWGDDIDTVRLRGPGGVAMEAEKISNFLRKKEVTTIVSAGNSCQSACAMIWLSGSERIAEKDADIGLHFAYIPGSSMETIASEWGWNGVRKTLNELAIWSYNFYDGLEIADKDKLFEKMSYNSDLWRLTPEDITDVIGATYDD